MQIKIVAVHSEIKTKNGTRKSDNKPYTVYSVVADVDDAGTVKKAVKVETLDAEASKQFVAGSTVEAEWDSQHETYKVRGQRGGYGGGGGKSGQRPWVPEEYKFPTMCLSYANERAIAMLEAGEKITTQQVLDIAKDYVEWCLKEVEAIKKKLPASQPQAPAAAPKAGKVEDRNPFIKLIPALLGKKLADAGKNVGDIRTVWEGCEGNEAEFIAKLEELANPAPDRGAAPPVDDETLPF